MKKFVFLFLLTLSVGAKAQNSDAIFSTRTGDYTISLLSEGQQSATPNILIGATPEMLARAIPDGRFPNAVNAFLIQTPERNILVDTGFGRLLFDKLDSLGLKPADIGDILLTHLHGDHIGGLMKDGQPSFPQATLYIAQPEYDYWMQSGNRQALAMLEAYRNRLILFAPREKPEADVAEPLPVGVSSLAAYGHTPGHVAFLLRSGKDQLLIWGDLTHAMAVQMPYPQVAVSYDVNPEEAVRSRQAILKYVSENKIPVAGMHIAYPGMGAVKADKKGGYVFTPLTENK